MKNAPEKKELLSMVITRAKIIEAMVEACMKSGITGENIHSKEELIMKRIYHKTKRHIKRHIRHLKKRLNFLEALRTYAGMPVGV